MFSQLPNYSLLSVSISATDQSVISASSALCTLIALLFALLTLVDSQHRIRLDRLDGRKPVLYRYRDAAGQKVWRGIKSLRCWGGGRGREASGDERQPLLSDDR